MNELTPNIYAQGCKHLGGLCEYRMTRARNGTLVIVWWRCVDCGRRCATVRPA